MFNFLKNIASSIILLSSFYNTSAQSSTIDIKAYDFTVDCDFNNRILNINANLTIGNDVNSKIFKLLLSADASIQSVKSGDQEIKFSRIPADSDTLMITSMETLTEMNFSFRYTLPLDSFMFRNVIVLRRENCWYPLQYNNISNIRSEITVPAQYTVLTSADLIFQTDSGEKIQYIFENSNALSYSMVIAETSAFNAVQTKKINSATLNFYFFSADTAINNKIINEICQSFFFYSEHIGQYKHERLNIIEIPDRRVQFVQSLGSLIIIGAPFINYYAVGYSNWPPHETAHQWWGSGIFIDSKDNGRWFLEESLCEYLSALYTQNILGEDSFKKQLETYLKLYSDVDKDKELPILKINNVSTKENGYVIYQKGPLIFNKLKNSMGEKLWWELIREIYETYYGKLLTYGDFINTLSKYSKNEGLENRFNQWLSEIGYSD